MKVVCASGYFDPLHVGHLEYLEMSRQLGDRLVVIVNNDSQAKLKKGKPFMGHDDRLKIIRALKCVDEVFVEESLELKGSYIKKYNADVLLMGNDWVGKFDDFKSICNVVYLDRTPSISTTELIEIIKS